MFEEKQIKGGNTDPNLYIPTVVEPEMNIPRLTSPHTAVLSLQHIFAWLCFPSSSGHGHGHDSSYLPCSRRPPHGRGRGAGAVESEAGSRNTAAIEPRGAAPGSAVYTGTSHCLCWHRAERQPRSRRPFSVFDSRRNTSHWTMAANVQ